MVEVGCEANQVGIQPTPGAVFVNLRRRRSGRITRSMFIELTIGEAGVLLRDLESSLKAAIEAM